MHLFFKNSLALEMSTDLCDVLTRPIPTPHPSSAGATIHQGGNQQADGHRQGRVEGSTFETPFPEDCFYWPDLELLQCTKPFPWGYVKKIIIEGSVYNVSCLTWWRKTEANNRLTKKFTGKSEGMRCPYGLRETLTYFWNLKGYVHAQCHVLAQ